MKNPTREMPLLVAIAGLTMLSACASDFTFQLPANHPAQPNAPTGGQLLAPNPFEVLLSSGPDEGASGMEEMHADPDPGMETMPPGSMSGHAGHGGGH